MELVSFDDLKSILDINKTEAEYPDLEIIKDSVKAMFEDYTNRIFDEDKYTQNFYPQGMTTKMIPLDAIPVKSVSSVLINGAAITSYKIRNYGLELNSSVSDCDIEVIYTGGIETAPKGMNRAALLQTVYEYQNKHSIGLEIVSNDGGSITKPELGMLKEVKTLLKSEIHPFPRF